MGDVAACVGFAGWAFAAMCDHALFSGASFFIFLRCIAFDTPQYF